MKTLKLRDYQREAIDALETFWSGGGVRGMVVLPTGMGKTVVFAELARREHDAGRRTLVLVDRDVLVQQSVDKLAAAAPGASIGVVQAERNEWRGRDIVVGSVQTLSRPERLADIPIDQFHLVIVDECEAAVTNQYAAVLGWFGCLDETRPTRTAGFTATPSRSDGVGLGSVWQKIVYRKRIMDGIAHGHLVDVRGRTITVDGLDLSAVTRAGQLETDSFGDRMIEAGAGKVIAEAYLEYGRSRPAILFAPSVNAAFAFAGDLRMAGAPSMVVVGETSRASREKAFAAARSGEVKVLVTCDALVKGLDIPEIEVCLFAKHTVSERVYVQAVGRVLRPAPWAGKTEALLLDFVGVSSRLRLASRADLGAGIVPAEGETLGEAVRRVAGVQLVPGAGTLDGAVAAELVDLFHRSESAWLRTYKGVWFVPTSRSFFFLWPEGGRYKVGRMGVFGKQPGDGWLDVPPMEIGMAMAWAEDAAYDEDPTVSRKDAPWRKKKAPSQAQLAELARYKIPVPEGLRKQGASDLLSVHTASRVLDRGL